MKQGYDANIHRLLRAESFCTELIANGLSFEEINIYFAGSFKKSYRDDVESVAFSDNDLTGLGETVVTVNRDSIYDRLPEGLFHQTRGSSKNAGVKDMTSECRRYKDEEKAARKFFQPFDQEFFKYSTLTETEEQSLAMAMLAGGLKNELHEFWEVGEGLPPGPAQILVRIMPWVNHIKGNRSLTAKALELILDKPVETEEYQTCSQRSPASAFQLGDCSLGVDSVSGYQFSEESAGWRFKIKEVSNDEMPFFTTNESYGRFLRQFEEIFIPLTIDITFDFEQLADQAGAKGDILGYNLKI